MKKIFNLCCVEGTYMQGTEQKKRYKQVGAVLNGQYGDLHILDATFNPAGVPAAGRLGKNLEGPVILYAFEPRDEESPRQKKGRKQQKQYRDPLDDDIPF